MKRHSKEFFAKFDTLFFRRTMKGVFLILEGRDAGRVVPIDPLPFRIGRLIENNLILTDEQVSRHHARVESGISGLILVDERSRNGIFVNQQRVEKHVLSVGDRIRIGGTVLIYQPDEGRAREVLADSIPDSPAFAVESSYPGPEEEEPTKIRALADLESQGLPNSSKSLIQCARLFSNHLPAGGVGSQLLDIIFQGFLPERAEVIWNEDPGFQAARSRSEGKKCRPFAVPESLQVKASRGAMVTRDTVPVPYGKGQEERLVLLCPLIRSGKAAGWIYADRMEDQPVYSSKDVEAFDSIALIGSGVLDRAALLTDVRGLRKQISLMEKHLSPEVVRMLAEKGVSLEESALTVERREVSVLFADIQGFTPISERLSPEELAQLLNEYFQRMVDVIISNQGTLNKFIGDAIMALFGAPKSYGNDAANAVSAGLQMIEELKKLWLELDERKRFNIRVGINTGHVVAGNIGSEKKMEYTVLGDAVNLASRYEGISPANTVTIGDRTAELVKGMFELQAGSSVKVKGKSNETRVYQVIRKLTP